MIKLYDSQSAAGYLRLALSTVQRYALEGKIEAQILGGSWVFTQDALDAYKSVRRSAGRPREKRKYVKKEQ